MCPNCGYSPQPNAGCLSFVKDSSPNQGFQDSHFSDLHNVEQDSFWFAARNALITWALQRYFPDIKHFMEVGCGTGFVLSAIASTAPDVALTGSELSELGLSIAKTRVPSADFFQADIKSLPFSAEFDVIGAFDVLEHIQNDIEALKSINRALTTSGGLILTVPQHPSLWSQTDVSAKHVRRYVARDLMIKLHSAGFTVNRVTSFVSLLLPLMWISRRTPRRKTRCANTLPELELNGLINYFFSGIMYMERLMIRAGINFPLGGSLLIVAQKQNENTV